MQAIFVVHVLKIEIFFFEYPILCFSRQMNATVLCVRFCWFNQIYAYPLSYVARKKGKQKIIRLPKINIKKLYSVIYCVIHS